MSDRTNVNGGRPSKSIAEGVKDIGKFGKNDVSNPPGPSKKRGASSKKGAQEGVRSINR